LSITRRSLRVSAADGSVIPEFHHLGYATRSIERSRDLMAEQGYVATSDVIRDETIGVTVQFLSALGAPTVELVAPIREDSPVIRILQQRSGLYHTAWLVDDLTHLDNFPMMRRATPMTDAMPAVAFENRLVRFFALRDGSIVEFICRESR
jgi:methylmalonyl-CoA/ethylmalonyl-CoA epimerase